MARKYWIDLFNGSTWKEFLEHGGTISGYSETYQKQAAKVKPGDYFICYATVVSRLIGVLEVISGPFTDDSVIWKDAVYPVRFKVKVLYDLKPEHSIPIKELREKLTIFDNLKSPSSWSGIFRRSLNQFKEEDGKAIVDAIKGAVANPVEWKLDLKKYYAKANTFDSSLGTVTVPETEEEEKPDTDILSTAPGVAATHEEIQWLLLSAGSRMGLDVWVASNDRNKSYNGNRFRDIKNLKETLPRQFDDATNRTIALIDVLWLNGDAIAAAFEVEHTTSIYSGLLRMADLVSMQPNLKIHLFIVAPDERKGKVFSEINRPTFSRLKPPLPEICRFIPYSELKKEIELYGERLRYMKPEFLDTIAQECMTEDS